MLFGLSFLGFFINILFNPQSAFHPWSAVYSLHYILPSVCSLHFTLTDLKTYSRSREALLGGGGGSLCPPSEFHTFPRRNFGRFTNRCWNFT